MKTSGFLLNLLLLWAAGSSVVVAGGMKMKWASASAWVKHGPVTGRCHCARYGKGWLKGVETGGVTRKAK